MDQREAIAANVQMAMESFSDLTDFEFGLDQRSVEWVEGFVERQRSRPDFDLAAAGGLVSVIGSYLGECVATATGGTWQQDEQHGWGIKLPNNTWCFPLAKTRKQFAEGVESGESIASFYRVAVDHLATNPLNP